MLEYRVAGDEHRSDIIDFINYVFSQSARPHDFKTLIPKVYADGRGCADIHTIALVDDHIHGCVGQYPVSLSYAGAPLKVGYIGSVSTYKYTRGAGHMKRLMQMQIDRAREKNIDIMMLGGQRQRYEYYGFTPCGAQITYHFVEANVRHGLKNTDASGVNWKKFKDASKAQIDDAYQIYCAQKITGARPREDFELIMSTWDMEPYVILMGAKVAGYMIAEEKNHFSELVLTDAAIAPRLMKAWYAVYAPENFYVTLAPFDAPLNRALAAFAEGYTVTKSEQARIICLKNVLAACLRLKQATTGLSNGKVVLKMDDETPVCARVANGEIEVFETEEAPDIALGRMEMQAFLFSCNRYEAPELACPVDWFPLPLYINAADHF